jgi:hypothetical protein
VADNGGKELSVAVKTSFYEKASSRRLVQFGPLRKHIDIGRAYAVFLCKLSYRNTLPAFSLQHFSKFYQLLAGAANALSYPSAGFEGAIAFARRML